MFTVTNLSVSCLAIKSGVAARNLKGVTMLGIISDIHGNIVALEAVLADAKEQGVEDFICLGDVANVGPRPRETLGLLKSLNSPVVLGNTDAWLLKPRTIDEVIKITKDTATILDIESWAASKLDDEDKVFINSWPMYINFEYKNVSILAFHASPENYNTMLLPTTDDEEVDKHLAGFKAEVFIHGHTHTQYIRKYHDSRILNPGSVGLPYIKTGDKSYMPTFAEYAILKVENGQANISFRRVVYRLQDIVEMLKDSDMPHQDKWLEPIQELKAYN